MKKLILLATGLVLLASAVIFVPQAATSKISPRDRYHQYLYRQTVEYRNLRRFTGGSARVLTENRTAGRHGTDVSSIRNLRYGRNKRNLYSSRTRKGNRNLPFRPVSVRRGTLHSHRGTGAPTLANRPYGSIPNNWKTYRNDTFVVEVPESSTPNYRDGHFNYGAANGIDVTIKRIEATKECLATNFFICARSVLKTDNRALEQKIGYSNVYRIDSNTTRYHQSLGEMEQDKVFEMSSIVETFDGQSFVAQRVIKGEGENELFLIDIRSAKDKAHYAIPFAKRIVDTFHILPLEERTAVTGL